jgi:uncharacterized protein
MNVITVNNMDIFDAILDDDVNQVNYWLSQNIDIDMVSYNGITPLYLACKNFRHEILDALLDAGANKHCVTKDGWTPLLIYCKKNNVYGVKKLISRDVRIEQGKADFLPIFIAAINDHVEIVQELVKAGASIDVRNENGETPLFGAAEQGNINTVQCLLQAGADVDIMDNRDRLPIYMAAAYGYKNVVRELLRAGSDCDYNLLDALLERAEKNVKKDNTDDKN